MPCFRPLKAYYGSPPSRPGVSKNRRIVFKRSEAWLSPASEPQILNLPCGQCVGCRLERSRQWAVRCMHEAGEWPRNCFITLTYSDDKLPPFKSLVRSDFQNFMKALRREYGQGIRVFYCGEYGPKGHRPHFHACLFNFDFTDREWRVLENGKVFQYSPSLNKLWKGGFCSVGDVTFKSAAYVARYIVDKLNISGRASNKDAEAEVNVRAFLRYTDFDMNTGEYFGDRIKEFVGMSLKPGIGRRWFERYKIETYNTDSVVIRRDGRYVEMKPPKYYDNQFEILFPSDMQRVKADREEAAKKRAHEFTDERLQAREKHCIEKLKHFSKREDL